MRINLRKISRKTEKTVEIFVERSFFASICLILLAFAIGGFLYYKYDFLVDKAPVDPSGAVLKIDDAAYGKILNEWQKRDENSLGAGFKNYLNPFYVRDSQD
jgi:hypothetical protein